MGQPMKYDAVATVYAETRWALAWLIEPMRRVASSLPTNATVLDIGCGTGDYLAALTDEYPFLQYRGFDTSAEMITIAKRRCPLAALVVADAEAGFPCCDSVIDLMFCINVLHHLSGYERFFIEAHRGLRSRGKLFLFTDSREDITSRSLAQFFPETVSINLLRYPLIEDLIRMAEASGLSLLCQARAAGYLPLDDRLMDLLRRRGISELRLLPDDVHTNGIQRAEEARTRGEKWLSQTTVLEFEAGHDLVDKGV
jgi:ubiquinone/menaquinone biosynthesis C-methylase UbiE